MTYLLLFAKILLWLGWRLRRDISKFFRPNLTLYFSGYFRVFGQIEANVGLTLPDEISDQWEALKFDHQKFLGNVDLSVPAGEQGYTPLEMIWSRPTCEINGIIGGYTGEGFKTVLPSKASAKVSFRLV